MDDNKLKECEKKMNNYKNIFMFKNPVRHFLNPENVKYPEFSLEADDLDNVDWTIPISFKIRKYYGQNEVRNLKIPNFLNFNLLFKHCSNMPNFYNLEKIGQKISRVKVNLETGDFSAFSYQKNVELDLQKLTLYDYVYKFDIKSFYKSIYTHTLVKYTPFSSEPYKNEDRFITNLNNGHTDGILMGNYISLYLAEHLLTKIMSDLKQELKSAKIPSKINNFSDDIYIFSNEKYESLVKKCVSTVLTKYELELNENKTEFYDYVSYNNLNFLTKLWKRVIKKQKDHESYIDNLNMKNKSNLKYYMNFTNQLIYRLSELDDFKYKSIFIKNFFKSSFFKSFDVTKYNVIRENVHQLQFIMSEHPETILYIIPKIKESDYLRTILLEWLKDKFFYSLEKDFYEEQLYFLFGLIIIHGEEQVVFEEETFESLMKSDNQILKSFILMFNAPENIDLIKYLKHGEENWFLNYHIILKIFDVENLEQYILDYLIPDIVNEKCSQNKEKAKRKKEFYLDFYKENITLGNKLIKEYVVIENDILEYLQLKADERVKHISQAQNYNIDLL